MDTLGLTEQPYPKLSSDEVMTIYIIGMFFVLYLCIVIALFHIYWLILALFLCSSPIPTPRCWNWKEYTKIWEKNHLIGSCVRRLLNVLGELSNIFSLIGIFFVLVVNDIPLFDLP